MKIRDEVTLLLIIDAALRDPPVYFEQNSNKPSNIGQSSITLYC
jgi:hypothetical protein